MSICYHNFVVVHPIPLILIPKDSLFKGLSNDMFHLQKARIIRKHRQEYDALAKVCDVETLYPMDTFFMHLNNVWVEGGRSISSVGCNEML